MQPGLPRAVPMGIIGFLLGAALVIIIRGLQSMDPQWDPEIGLVFAGFMAAGFFVWGIGAFNPKLSEHHVHAPEEFELVPASQAHHDDHHEEAPEPFGMLSQQMWQITFWIIVGLVILFGFATLPGGFFQRISGDPLASTAEIGFFTMNIFGTEYVVSEFVMFIIIAAVILGSLGAVGGGIAYLFFNLSQNVAQVKAAPAEPVPAEVVQETTLRRVIRWGMALALFIVLYFLFYYVLIGLVLGAENPLLPWASLINAALVVFIIFWSGLFVKLVGGISRWLLRVLRGVPGFLGQK